MNENTRTVSSFDGVQIRYESRGRGRTALIFVHGFSCNRRHWDNQADVFSEKYQVVTLDLAGHGESGRDRTVWDMRAFGEDVASVVRELGLDNIVLVGHSMGASVISEAARMLSSETRGIVAVDNYKRLGIFRTPQQIDEMTEPFQTDFVGTMTEVFNGMFLPDANDEIRNEVVKGAISIPKNIGIEVYRAARTYENEGLKASLEALEIPKFAINSEELRGTDLDAAREYGVEVWPIKGVGHFVMLDDPEGFNAMLDDILDQISEKENDVGG